MNKMVLQSKGIRFFTAGVMIFMFIFFSSGLTSHAAMQAYMRVESTSTGAITGDVTQSGRENTHSVYDVQHQIEIPLDSSTGLPSGQRLHRPFLVTTNVNQGLPLFYQLLITGDNTTDITIDYYRINYEGREERYYSVFLEDAIITGIQHHKHNVLNPDNRSYPDMVTLSFVYGRITWSHVIDATEYSDSWTSPRL